MALRRFGCLFRVYRASRAISDTQRVALQDYTDIYEEDKKGTLHPDWDDVAIVDPLAFSQRTAILDAPAAIDIQPGYLVEIKKRKVVWNQMSAVSASVTTNPASGATTLVVSSTTRFEAGDQCVLTDASGSFMFRLKDVDETALTLSLHEGLPRAFTSATVAAKEYWLVTGIKNREDQSEYQSLRLRLTLLRAT